MTLIEEQLLDIRLRPPLPAENSLLVVSWTLDPLRTTTSVARSVLPPGELERANRFRRLADRQRYLGGRIMLRLILAHWLDIPAHSIQFSLSQYGKPGLSKSPFTSEISFNLSHSEGLIAAGFARGRQQIGIDVEHIGRARGALEVADRLHPLERALIARAENDAKLSRFLEIWVRKEAAMKADGRGVGIPLDQYSVLADQADGFQIRSLDVPDDYRGAIAVEQEWSLRDIQYHDWPHPEA